MDRALRSCLVVFLTPLAFIAITATAHAQAIPITTHSAAARRIFTRGVDQVSNFRLAEAESTFAASLRADPTAPMPCAMLAYLQHLDLKSGAALARRAVRLARHTTGAEQTFAAAVEALDAGRTEDAVSRADALRDQFPASWLPALLLFDVAFIQKHDYPAAERELRAAVQQFPKNNFLNNALGYSLLYQKKADEARPLFEENAREHADEPNPWDSLGNVYMALGMTKRAIAAYERSVRIDGRFRFLAYFGSGVPLHLAAAYVAAQRMDDAEQTVQDWLRAYPSDAHGYDALGEIYRRTGRLGEAADEFQHALRIQPLLTTARDHLVRTRVEQEDRAFSKAVRTRDADGLIDVYTSTAKLMPAGSLAVEGSTAIRAYWTARQAAGLTDVQLQTTELYVGSDGKTATEIGQCRFGLGDHIADHGNYIVVWQQTPAGWRIHRQMWTRNSTS